MVKTADLVSFDKSDFIVGETKFTEKKGLLVTQYDLGKNSYPMTLDVANLETSIFKEEISPVPIRKLTQSALLLSRDLSDVRVKYFHFEGQEIYITYPVIALKVDDKLFSPEFLVYQFYQDDFIASVRKLSQKNYSSFSSIWRNPLLVAELIEKGKISFLTGEDILSIQFPHKEIEVQNYLIREVNKHFLFSRDAALKYEFQKVGIENDFQKELSSMRHSIRQYLSALASNIEGTKLFIEKNEGQEISLQSIYSKNLRRNLGEHFDIAMININSMDKLLGSFDMDYKAKKNVKVQNIFELLNLAVNQYSSGYNFKFEIINGLEDLLNNSSADKDFREHFKEFDKSLYELEIDQDDLSCILYNIFQNAIDHGFNKESTTNFFKIKVGVSSDEVVLHLSNNGKPFPAGFTTENFTIRGNKGVSSTGSGIGGSDIEYIMSSYGGSINILNQPDDIFPVTYILTFPRKQI